MCVPIKGPVIEPPLRHRLKRHGDVHAIAQRQLASIQVVAREGERQMIVGWQPTPGRHLRIIIKLHSRPILWNIIALPQNVRRDIKADGRRRT